MSVRLPQERDVYEFVGLNAEALEPDGRTVHIESLAVNGDVLYRIGFMGVVEKQLHSTPLPTVLALIEHRRWILDPLPR